MSSARDDGDFGGHMYSTGQRADIVATEVAPDSWDASPPAKSNLHAVTDDDSLSPAEQFAWRAFVDGTHALLVTLDKALVSDADLGLGEFMILTVLSENDSMRMSDLSAGGLASRSTISRQVSRLVDIGDIARLPDSTDARNRLVAITDRGRDHLRSAGVDHARRVRRHLLDHVSAAQLEDLGRTFTRVRDGLDPA